MEDLLHPILFHLGRFAIPAYGFFTVLALVAAVVVMERIAGRLGLDPARMGNTGVLGILAALVAGRLLMVVELFSVFRRHPFWVLGVSFSHATWIDAAALAVGFAVALLYAAAEGLSILGVLDGVAPAAALAVALNRVGAFLGGLDYGLPAGHAWSVTYTSAYAATWSRTPLGVGLHPVQIYECIASFAIFVVLMLWLPHRTRNGELWGAWLFLYGVAAFFLSFLRASDQTLWVVHRPEAFGMVAVSAAFLVRRRAHYTSPDASLRA